MPSLANISKAREVSGGIILRTSWISTDYSRREIQGRILEFTYKTYKRNMKDGDGGDDVDKATGD